MSFTVCLVPFSGCLQAAEEKFLGLSCTWQSINNEQRIFLIDDHETRPLLPKVPELSFIASQSNEEINQFFANGGFPEIRFDPLGDGELGAGSILSMIIEWLKAGTDFRIPDKEDSAKSYPGFKLEEDYLGHGFSGLDNNPVTRIRTRNRDVIYVTMPKMAPKNQFDVLCDAKKIALESHGVASFGNLIMPCVELDQWVDADWILGMHTFDRQNNYWAVAKALQKTRFKVNKYGARVESAAGIVISLGAYQPTVPKPDHVIDEPFYFVIERPGFGIIAAAYIDKSDWKDPGVLGMPSESKESDGDIELPDVEF